MTDLLQRKPYLGRLFQDGDAGPFSLAVAKNDAPVVLHRGGDREQALASRHDPGREIERLVDTARLDTLRDSEIVLILGLGNPLVLDAVSARLADGQICLAVDASFELGRLLCRKLPLVQSYLERPGCHLFPGKDYLVSLQHYIEGLPAERLSGLRVLRHPASLRLAPDFYEGVEADIREILKSKMSDLLTRFEFERTWLKNIVINSRRLPPLSGDDAGTLTNEEDPARATVGPFQNALANLPGVLIAAGPSLRDSFERIARLKERAFLLACDTALKPLIRAGIVPHAVLTLDAQQHTLFHFLGADGLAAAPGEILFFADLVCHPAVLRRVEEHARAMIFSTTARVQHRADGSQVREATPGTEHAEEIHGQVGSVQSGGSVATTGFDLLRNLGCDPILLIGQDLAYTGRRIHSPGTHHQERWLAALQRDRSLPHIIESVVRKRRTFPVDGLDGSAVLGDYVLNLYRAWFEQSIPDVNIRVVNLTREGARIAGADRPADIDAFIDALPPLADPRDRFAGAPRPHVFDHALNRELYRDLNAAVRAGDADARRALFEKYEYLRPLNRRAEVYLKRNREKLGEERARELAENNVRDALESLERSLRPFFAESAPAPPRE